MSEQKQKDVLQRIVDRLPVCHALRVASAHELVNATLPPMIAAVDRDGAEDTLYAAFMSGCLYGLGYAPSEIAKLKQDA